MITKQDLIEIIESLEIPYNETDFTVTNMNQLPRVAFYEFAWDSINASGTIYIDEVTYQIDFYSITTRHPKLLLLRRLLKEKGIVTTINHEHIEDESHNRYIHSFMSVTVLEDLNG